jgi:hypothetical protein
LGRWEPVRDLLVMGWTTSKSCSTGEWAEGASDEGDGAVGSEIIRLVLCAGSGDNMGGKEEAGDEG